MIWSLVLLGVGYGFQFMQLELMAALCTALAILNFLWRLIW